MRINDHTVLHFIEEDPPHAVFEDESMGQQVTVPAADWPRCRWAFSYFSRVISGAIQVITDEQAAKILNLTPELLDHLVAEAEAGYEPEQLRDRAEVVVSESMRWVLPAYGLGPERSKQAADVDAKKLVAELRRRGFDIRRASPGHSNDLHQYTNELHDAEAKLSEIRDICFDSPDGAVDTQAIMGVIQR